MAAPRRAALIQAFVDDLSDAEAELCEELLRVRREGSGAGAGVVGPRPPPVAPPSSAPASVATLMSMDTQWKGSMQGSSTPLVYAVELKPRPACAKPCFTGDDCANTELRRTGRDGSTGVFGKHEIRAGRFMLDAQMIRGEVRYGADGSVVVMYSDPQDSFTAAVQEEGADFVMKGLRRTPSGQEFEFTLKCVNQSPEGITALGGSRGGGVVTAPGAPSTGRRTSKPVEMHLRTLTGGTEHFLVVCDRDTVGELLQRIRERLGLSPTDQLLVAAKHVGLISNKPERTLTDVGITGTWTLYQVQRIR